MRLFVVLTVLLVACATPYQSRKFSGGYSDEKVADDVYEVTFAANGATRDETVRTYLLYRCAELTKQNGFDHFVVLEDKDLTDSYISMNGGTVERPARSAKVKLGKGPKPDGANSYV